MTKYTKHNNKNNNKAQHKTVNTNNKRIYTHDRETLLYT